MDEAPKYHMTIVREKRRPRHSRAPDPAAEDRRSRDAAAFGAEPMDSSSEASGREHAQKSRRSHSGSGRRRHYSDYGTVDLGAISPDAGEVPAPVRSQGREQREFMEKYSPVLNRKYRSRETGGAKSWALIIGSILIALLLIYFVFFRSAAEPDTAPSVETIPVIDINEVG